MARALAKKVETSTTLLEAAKKVLRQNGHSGLSTRDVAAAAGVPLSQIHYHFGSKQGLMLALFDYLNAQLLDRQNAMFHDTTLSLSQRWDRACDYLDEDIASGYVRVLQELIAASWSDPEVAKVVRAGLMGWFDLIADVARQAEKELGGLGPFSRRGSRSAGRAAPSSAAKASSCWAPRRKVRRCASRCGASATSSVWPRANHPRGDAMRAKLPEKEGFAERNGNRIHYEVYGQGPQTMVFLPPWSIVHSRVYKAQIPYFSERFRCIAYDALGNGQSDRPDDTAAYSLNNCVADALAVMDATDAGEAILVGLSFGGLLACCLAAYHPERAKAAILAGVLGAVGPNYSYTTTKHFLAQREAFEGWDKYNRAHWLANYPDFAEHFVKNIFSEPHSTKQIEDGVAWANDTSGPVLVKTVEARAIMPAFDVTEAMYRRIRCPVLAIHGDDDQIQPYGRGKLIAELTGGELLTMPGGGHNPLGRYPAKCNAAINDFLDRRLGIPARQAGAARDEGEARALSLLADRPRPRPPRHRHRAGTAQAPARPQGRLAGAGPGDAPADGQRRDHPSAERAACQRIAPHRGRVGRARSQRLPGDPPHGRGADQELHDLPGCRRVRRLRPGHRRRGLGHRPLLA